ncbi:MAG: 1-acyl-sn-glycerol-3-phosphate acyltransferase [Candidatus Omnitrophica bacterium]|nr:1-acyl-sn-glycerol-3-phosphate acyltransferase [Candidatus Omnitrophota bacterium]
MLYKLGKIFFWVILKIFFKFKVRGVENIPKEGGFILAVNHASFLDPIVIGVASPRELLFLAKEQLFVNPFFAWLIRQVHAVPLKRNKMDITAIKKAISWVSRGGALLIFPEGKRTEDGSVGKLQEGIGFLAQRLKVPVIPAYLSGTYKALPKGHWRIRLVPLSVTFGKQIVMERRMAYQDFADVVKYAIESLA